MPGSAADIATVVGVIEPVTLSAAAVRPGRLADAPVVLRVGAPRADLPRLLYVRVASHPSALLPQIRQVVAAHAPDLDTANTKPVSDILLHAIEPLWWFTASIAALAAIGLLLAGIGVYGLTNHDARLRSHEYAIRIALGAPQRSIVWLAVSSVARAVTLSLLLGLLGAHAASGMLRSLVVGAGSARPIALVWAVTMLAVTAAAASVLPIRRALSQAPSEALRAL